MTCTAGRGEDVLGVVPDGAFVVEEGRVAWVGTTKELGRKSFGKPARTVDAEGGLVFPGLVDPHTHLAFAGSREDELERKIGGESYLDILRSGGGISRTVGATRDASVSRIVRESADRAVQLLRGGVTTVEVKTGYGQSLEQELKMLRSIAELSRVVDMEVVPTFLGLHAKPPEFDDARSYADHVVKSMLPEVARAKARPRFSDCFCEEDVFTRDECSRYLRASAELGLGLKIHADEFEESGGASLAASSGCVSADHLGRSSEEGIRAMSRKGVTAVLLPATSLFSGIKFADARSIMEAGCRVALGTDLSPNSWVESPQLVMWLACTGMKMSPAEALLGFTRNAAQAVGRDDIGAIRAGSQADFVVSALPGYRFLPYRVGGDYVRMVFRRGRRVFDAEGLRDAA